MNPENKPAFCGKCGARLEEGSAFCSSCGAPATQIAEHQAKTGKKVIGYFVAYVPGFRTLKAWKMILASIYYLICLIFMLLSFWVGLWLLSIPFAAFNVVRLFVSIARGKTPQVISFAASVVIFIASFVLIGVTSADSNARYESLQAELAMTHSHKTATPSPSAAATPTAKPADTMSPSPTVSAAASPTPSPTIAPTATAAPAATPSPTPSPTSAAPIYQAGMYKVGQDLDAGTYYIAADHGAGYYAVTKDSSGELGSIIANGNVSTFSFIAVKAGEYIEVKNASFLLSGQVPAIKPVDGKYGTGMYRIGIDLQAGEYQLIPDGRDGCYVAVLKDAAGVLSSIVSNDNFSAKKYISVKDGQYLQLKGCHIDAK